jgi:hypothetical protein
MHARFQSLAVWIASFAFGLRAMIGVRIDVLLAWLALLSFTAPLRATTPSACDVLPAAVVSSIAGEIVHPEPTTARAHDGTGTACRYIGKDRTVFTLSVRALASEAAAREAFERELTRVFGPGTQGELLRGVGAKARFGVSDPTRHNTIVARHSVTVFVLAGHADQAKLVSLARSVIARLERPEPE